MNIELNIYYASWCHFCSLFHNEDNRNRIMDMAKKYKGLKVKIVEEGNMSQDEKNSISGFPNIKIKANNEEYDYKGERTVDAIYKHMDKLYKNLEGMSGGCLNCKLNCGCGDEKPGMMQGGGKNYQKNYKKKYLKYKMKYLMLKDIGDE